MPETGGCGVSMGTELARVVSPPATGATKPALFPTLASTWHNISGAAKLPQRRRRWLLPRLRLMVDTRAWPRAPKKNANRASPHSGDNGA